MTKEEQDDLAFLISQLAVRHNGPYRLSSGRVSDYYIDKYAFTTQPVLLRRLGRFLSQCLPDDTDRIAGTELGAIPLATATSFESSISCIFVRKEKHDYGLASWIEGELIKGDKVVLIEDITTTGKQVLESAYKVEEAGGKITKIVSVVDREEGAKENIEAAGYSFEYLLTKTHLLV